MFLHKKDLEKVANCIKTVREEYANADNLTCDFIARELSNIFFFKEEETFFFTTKETFLRNCGDS